MTRGMPSMTALLGLLAIAGYQNRDKIAEIFGRVTSSTGAPAGTPSTSQQSASQSDGFGGLFGGLGGLLGGSSAGSIVNGGLSELVQQFEKNGYGDAAASWVGTGENRQLGSTDLEQAIGPDVLDTLAQQTGLPREELLSRLTRELPGAVDRYTPEGRLPNTRFI